MRADVPHGTVLLLVTERAAGDLLVATVAEAGERGVVVAAGDALASAPEVGPVDLVVTDLDLSRDLERGLLNRLVAGSLFPAAPRLHLLRDATQARVALLDASGGTTLPSPPDPDEFRTRVRLAAEIGRLRRELDETIARDPMTGALNRRALLRRIDEEFARARRHRSPLSLVLLDIDGLGAINERFGELSGDSVVLRFAEVVRKEVRKEDVFGRLAGATLAVLLPGNGVRGAATFAGKVRTESEEIVLRAPEETVSLHVSAGLTTYPDDPTLGSGERLVRSAQEALLRAKARGGNRVQIQEAALRHDRRVVLIADPDPDLLDLAEDLLSVDDLHVVRARTARAALETLRFRRPHLLILDLQMVDRDGRPLLDEVEALFPDAGFPIIGLAREAIAPGLRVDRRVDRFVTKPFSPSLLRDAARELLGVHS